MNITKLVLHEVACFDHVEMRFPPGRDPKKADVHVLVGPNGTGKTTILLALAQMWSMEPLGLERRLRQAQSYVLVESDFTSSFFMTTHQAGHAELPEGLTDFRFSTGPGGPLLCLEGGPVASSVDLDVLRRASMELGTLPKGTRFPFAVFAYGGRRQIAPSPLQAIQELRESPLAGALRFTHESAPGRLVQWIANTKAKVAFARERNDEARAERLREAVARIERVIQSIIEKEFRFEMLDDPLGVTAVVDGQEVELDVLPDGLQSIISWVADLLMRLDRIPWVDDTPVLERPFLLLLDEIEVHLHPAWQRRVLPAVQGLFPNAQVFLSTHSPFIVASADDAWIHRLREQEGKAGVVVDPPIPSKLGNSYAAVLRDVLGIEEEFAPQVEERLESFYASRDRTLRGEVAIEELKGEADALRQVSEELAAIVVPELRQVQRHLGKGNGEAR